MAKKKQQQLSTAEAHTLITEKRAALREFRFQINGGKVKNMKAGRELKKGIARILTNLHAPKAAI
ncbi:MAG: 50S ribosomal protein L29 [Parcubacteria group bacterium RIFOXYD2_FULL_52_8]|nr:MAG: 50S ribosomal protein L29 [Parcubacteria group bacterium RIFOXYD2_FULL_52_8]